MQLKIKNQKNIWTAVFLLTAFVLWTVAVSLIDVQAIGPKNSQVGLATMNRFFHNLTGIHMSLYIITDWLSLVPFGLILFHSFWGLIQWVKRKHILKVDRSILILGGFYLIVLMTYLFFEVFVINSRPVLIDGVLEASYPSSTTILTLCTMSTSWLQLKSRINSAAKIHFIHILMILFTAFMIIARAISGVHWISDIIGGCLLSSVLYELYCYISDH